MKALSCIASSGSLALTDDMTAAAPLILHSLDIHSTVRMENDPKHTAKAIQELMNT